MRLIVSTWVAAAAWSWALTAVAAADNASGEKAVAEALFNEGVALIAAGEFSSGCAKLEGSQALEATLGTALRLADCYERVGKTASAWALFKHAEGVAHRQGENDRETIARARAEALTPRLSYLVIRLRGELTRGLSITKNETVMPLASLGVALPVDPGFEAVTVSAPGYLSWSGTVEIPAGPGTQTVEIPPLQPAPAPVAAPTPVSAGPVTGPNPLGGTALAPPLRPASASTHHAQFLASARKAIGISAISVGSLGLLTGLGLGWYAKQQNEDSRRFCPFDGHNGCTSDGIRLRERAKNFALASTLTTAGSAAIVGTGIVLWLTTPTAPQPVSASGMRFRTSVTPRSVATTIEGWW